MRLPLNFLNSIAGIRLLFIFGVIIPLSVIPTYLNPNSWGLWRSGHHYRGRASEGRAMIGALNRAQQAYFTEYNEFADNFTDLDYPIDTPKYYQFSIVSSFNGDKLKEKSRIMGVVMTGFPNEQSIQRQDNSIYPLVGVTLYDSKDRRFITRVCQSKYSKIDLNSIKIISSKMAIYPYQEGVNSSQKSLEVDDIFPCPDGFREIR